MHARRVVSFARNSNLLYTFFIKRERIEGTSVEKGFFFPLSLSLFIYIHSFPFYS